MKKSVLLLAVVSVLFLTSCQTTKEITLQNDGSGNYLVTTDMSSLIGMVKMSAPPEKLNEMGGGRAMDTTISLDKMAEFLEDLTEDEKEKVRKGTLGLNMDMKDDKFITKMSFPFSNASEIGDLDRLSSKVVTQFLKKQMGGADKAGEMPQGMPGADQMPDGSIDDYFDIKTSSGVVERKLNEERLSTLSVEKKQALQQMGSMGAGNSTIIINLPKPVKKTEGKNITVSDDKKKITIESSAEDFFDNAKNLEFRIEY
jgi:hypothetical protein